MFASNPNLEDADFPSDLWVMNDAGFDRTRLNDWRGFDSFPVWSPDPSGGSYSRVTVTRPARRRPLGNGEAFAGVSLLIMRADGDRCGACPAG